MKTLTEITVAATRDNTFLVDFTLGGHEGTAELTTPSAVRVFVEDTIDLAVDRDVRLIISERVADLLRDDYELVVVDVIDIEDPSAPCPFEADLHGLRHGIDRKPETLTF